MNINQIASSQHTHAKLSHVIAVSTRSPSIKYSSGIAFAHTNLSQTRHIKNPRELHRKHIMLRAGRKGDRTGVGGVGGGGGAAAAGGVGGTFMRRET